MDYSEANDKIDFNIRRTMKIKSFTGPKNEEIKYDKNFELNCIVLGKHSVKPVKDCSVKEYFSLLKYHDSLSA